MVCRSAEKMMRTLWFLGCGIGSTSAPPPTREALIGCRTCLSPMSGTVWGAHGTRHDGADDLSAGCLAGATRGRACTVADYAWGPASRDAVRERKSCLGVSVSVGWRLPQRFIPALPGGVQSRGQLHGKTVNLGSNGSALRRSPPEGDGASFSRLNFKSAVSRQNDVGGNKGASSGTTVTA
jgi:hypothetical protein